MKKKLAPFISGIGTGLCLAVVIMTLWGFIGPSNDGIQTSNLDQSLTASSDGDSSQDLNDSLQNHLDTVQQDAVQQDTGRLSESQATSNAQDPNNGGGVGLTSTPQNSYKVVEIKAGMTANQISELLVQEGLIDNAQAFHDLVVEQKKTQKFIAGKFNLRYGAPYEELISILTSQPIT